MRRLLRDDLVGWFWWCGLIVLVLVVWLGFTPLADVFQDQDGLGRFMAWMMVLAVAVLALPVLIGPEYLYARAVERRSPSLVRWRRSRPLVRVVAAGLAAAAALLVWALRPLYHGLVMLVYQYPLVTWIPVLLGVGVAALCALGASRVGWDRGSALRLLMAVRLPATVLCWAYFMVMLPSWQGRALYEATTYWPVTSLPASTQPRLLPKAAAQAYGAAKGMRHAHLAVEPSSDELIWSAEHRPGFIPRGRSDAIAVQPLDRVDGTLRRIDGGFSPAVSRVGPGSIEWKAYDRHYFTRLQERVVVPLGGGRAVALVPYLGYRGFPVRHPYWRGVYVYHQDGRLEDLTPSQALARPALARSGRLFPEKLARDLAEAYGYKSGAFAVLNGDERTEVSDPGGNPQPYLTNLGDGEVRWVTIAHSMWDRDTVRRIFLTNSATGRTEVWRVPPGGGVLSNEGAARLARSINIRWTNCCHRRKGGYRLRSVTEPRPVFAAGRFYYLVSIVPDRRWLHTVQPVDRTVLIDARERQIVHVFNHASSEADDRLRAFFRRARTP